MISQSKAADIVVQIALLFFGHTKLIIICFQRFKEISRRKSTDEHGNKLLNKTEAIKAREAASCRKLLGDLDGVVLAVDGDVVRHCLIPFFWRAWIFVSLSLSDASIAKSRLEPVVIS